MERLTYKFTEVLTISNLIKFVQNVDLKTERKSLNFKNRLPVYQIQNKRDINASINTLVLAK